MQVIFFTAIFHQCHLPDGFQHGVHIVDPHIRNPVNVNLSVQHEPLEIFMLDILTCGTPKERAEVVADLQKDNRLALMEARNRQIREDKYGTE